MNQLYSTISLSINALIIALMLLSKSLISQTIVYQQSIYIDQETLRNQVLKDTLEETDPEEKNYIEGMLDWAKSLAQRESKKLFSYVLGDKYIRYIRPISKGPIIKDEWIIIDRDKRVMNHHYLNKNNRPQHTKFFFDKTTHHDMEVEYEVVQHADDIKTILGHPCHRVCVTEIMRDKEYGTETIEYEMYVTDKIDLPFHLLNTTLKPVIDLCPLELTIRHPDQGTSSTKFTAIEIKEKSHTDTLALPDRFSVIH